MKFPGWKKLGVTFGFVGIQAVVVGAVGLLSFGIGRTRTMQLRWFTEEQVEAGIGWLGSTGTGFMTLLGILFGIFVVGLAGWILFKWGEWSFDYADDWMKERERKRKYALARRAERADRAIAEGHQSPSWEA